jgi:PhnB protein
MGTRFRWAHRHPAKMPPQNMFWGDRYSQVVDPCGHHWEIATTIRSVSDEQLHQAVSRIKG